MKNVRHAKILQIIEGKDVETQADLAEELKAAGYPVTQATVSRDIKELRLIKVLSEKGAYKYASVEKAEAGIQERLTQIFSQSVMSVNDAGNLIILKTIAGGASAAAETVDSMRLSEIVGTLAGDNTIFVAIKSVQQVPYVMKRFTDMIKR